ncbi:MAG: hypothetical protein IEMM0001_0633 [bacterium]|nr:MAG: hypothetical protein IEMM0001_0633 [bacterium]
MKNICPNCEKETNLTLKREKEVVDVRGEPIDVESEFYVCDECGEEFENTRDVDSLEVAYQVYRNRHHMLQPSEIKEWRKNYGLTQKELSQILGWGGATLSRYENGALQDEAHEKILRLAMESHNLRKLLEDSPQALSIGKKERLIKELTEAEEESCSFERMFEERFGNYEPDILSGYKKFDLAKVYNAILYFCRDGGQLKTKLNKLMFYADFKHFKDYTVSVTGLRYVHLPFGPVPNNYDFYYAELVKEGYLNLDEIFVCNYIGENYVSTKEVDFSCFSDSEIKILSEVKERFKQSSASEIKDFSHNEEAYKKTREGEIIEYSFAVSLSV